MRSHPSRFTFSFFGLCLLAQYLCAGIHILSLHLALPVTDLAYGQSMLETFGDPFVLWIGGGMATFAGMLIFPLAAISLRGRDIRQCGLLVLAGSAFYAAAVPSFLPKQAILLSPVVTAMLLLLCRLMPPQAFASLGLRLHARKV